MNEYDVVFLLSVFASFLSVIACMAVWFSSSVSRARQRSTKALIDVMVRVDKDKSEEIHYEILDLKDFIDAQKESLGIHDDEIGIQHKKIEALQIAVNELQFNKAISKAIGEAFLQQEEAKTAAKKDAPRRGRKPRKLLDHKKTPSN